MTQPGSSENAVIDIECIYEAVSDDEELFSFWQFVGMKAHYPPEAYIPASPSYQQQLKERIHDAVAISAPWLTDQATVERHVADWQDGRLASGDALFFQRFHIRPIAHLGTRLDFKRGESGDGTYDDVAVRYSTAATFDMLDAVGVSWPCIVHCKVFHAIGRLQQPRVWITVRHRTDNRLLVDTAPLDAQDVEDWDCNGAQDRTYTGLSKTRSELTENDNNASEQSQSKEERWVAMHVGHSSGTTSDATPCPAAHSYWRCYHVVKSHTY